MKRKVAGLLTVIVCLLPLITGVFGFGGAAQAAEEGKVDVTLHKKKMDQFPTADIENTGELMEEFNQYEGLPGVTFEAWDITADFYAALNKTVDPNASKEDYATAVKNLMKTFKLTDAENRVSKGTDETDEDGLANFVGLDKRTAEGTYKVYFFEEKIKDGVTASATPLILVLPVVKNDVENTDIHLYPKNKVKGEIDKELVDEDGNPLFTEPEDKKDRYDYEVGKKIYYHASFTIPNQIGEVIEKGSGQQTRYTKLEFKDAVSQNGVKFEGINRISIGDDVTDIKDAFLNHGVAVYANENSPYNEKAGFTITMNLNDAVSDVNNTDFLTSKATADYLKAFGGKTIHFYYAVSFTDVTPVDVDVNNKFGVDLTHDGGIDQHEEDGDVPPVVTGGKKFLKHESGKENQALAGAKFVVIKKDGGKEYYLTSSNSNVTWTEFTDGETFENATPYTSTQTGHIEVSGLAYGTYYLREIEAPNGFQLLTEDKEFLVAKDSFNETATLKIANVSKGGFLPSTGGTGIIAFLVVGLALMLGAFIRYRRIQQAAN